MDASTHADRKGERKERRDDVKQKGSEGRYEGGNDADQNRQAHGRNERDDETPAKAPPAAHGKARSGMGVEEEE